MPTRREPPIPTNINTHPKTPLRLILPNLLPPGLQIPHVYPPIVRRASQELPIFTQRHGPDLARFVAVYDVAFLAPFACVFGERPDLDFATETCAREGLAVAGCDEVVAA